MRVFVIGGTGSIGSAVVQELISRGHDVLALARSDVSAARLGQAGATPVPGDLAVPESWTLRLPLVDAVIHTACDFSTAMGALDRRLLDMLLPALAAGTRRRRRSALRSGTGEGPHGVELYRCCH